MLLFVFIVKLQLEVIWMIVMQVSECLETYVDLVKFDFDGFFLHIFLE